MAVCQAPTKFFLSLPSADRQERENIRKVSWVETRTRRDHSSDTNTGKAGHNLGYCLNVLLTKSEQDNEK